MVIVVRFVIYGPVVWIVYVGLSLISLFCYLWVLLVGFGFGWMYVGCLCCLVVAFLDTMCLGLFNDGCFGVLCVFVYDVFIWFMYCFYLVCLSVFPGWVIVC